MCTNYTEKKQSSIFFISKAELLAYVLCINDEYLRNIAIITIARTNQCIRETHIMYYVSLYLLFIIIFVFMLPLY